VEGVRDTTDLPPSERLMIPVYPSSLISLAVLS